MKFVRKGGEERSDISSEGLIFDKMRTKYDKMWAERFQKRILCYAIITKLWMDK